MRVAYSQQPVRTKQHYFFRLSILFGTIKSFLLYSHLLSGIKQILSAGCWQKNNDNGNDDDDKIEN
jgi:hypothetical protein